MRQNPLPVTLIGIQIDGFPNAINQGLKLPTLLVLICKRVNFSPFFRKLMCSWTNCSKIDGFPGSHGTHANGATVVVKRSFRSPKSLVLIMYVFKFCMLICYMVCTKARIRSKIRSFWVEFFSFFFLVPKEVEEFS